ncbi:MAG: hypothetical protein ABI759_15945 [Candidatus Solibacter sp.]
MPCTICKVRRPRRYCPGVSGEICAQCCGTEREVTVSCPLDCEYLRESRRHEKPNGRDPAEFPNRDIKVSEKLLTDKERLLTFLSLTIYRSAMETPGVADRDVLDALDGLVRTYRSLQSGLLYESRPGNSLAGAIYSAVQEAVDSYREREQQELGMANTRDADVLALLVFLQHFALFQENGRPRGRAFLDALRAYHVPAPAESGSAASSIILR